MENGNTSFKTMDAYGNWKTPDLVNSLTVKLYRAPSYQKLVSVFESRGIAVELVDGSDVYSLTMQDRSSDILSEVLGVLQNFIGCWIRVLRTIKTKPRSLEISNATLQMGNFLDHGRFIAHCKAPGDISVRLDGRQIELCIAGEFIMQFWSHEMEDFVVITLNQNSVSVFVTLRHPPRLSREQNANSGAEDRIRVSEVVVPGYLALKSKSFARCKTYQLIFEHSTYPPVVEYLEFLKKEVVFSRILVSTDSDEAREMQDLNVVSNCRHSASWDVNLAWLCVKSSPGFVPERFTPSFFKKLDSWNERVVVRGLFWLAQMMNKDHFLNPNDYLEYFPKACAIRRRNQNLENSTSNCRIPKLVLTPTRLVFFEPEIINSNRILRNWSDKTSFLKVSVRDENLEKLSRHTGNIKELLTSLFHQLKTGFDLVAGGKQFRFLGCSNNQVRDHGCFFVDVSNDCHMAEVIRESCGNLRYIRNVAKYISRLGQAFSTSIKTVKVKPNECERIPDIEHNGYTFTDGIGKISPDLAVEIAKKLENCPVVPCAFQVRFAGCKGVLAVDMGMKDRSDGRRLAFRDSMSKYWSNDTSIEVLASYSKPQELHLNQQLIMLLSNLDISDDVFMKLMRDQLKLMSNMFTNEEIARDRLSSMDCGIDWRLLFKTEFKTTSDPYFRSLLSALYKGRIKGLREKSRIPIDPLKARVLLGTVDETRTLQYGQVFIQISKQLKQPGDEKLIIQQRVVIGKSPCLHPGDVRTFNAIDCPLLHHMFDCVVFPSQGPRPHPNELSGSDLDGDLYHVIWLEELVPSVENKVSMIYPSVPVMETKDAVSTDDMLDFLQENIEFDCLGQINNIHKALVDQKGLESDCCLHLAELHAQAVDAPKTGQWPKIQSKFRKLLNKYPDFMMKEDKPSYPSNKVLGRMYRECTKLSNNENSSMNWRIPDMIQINGVEKFIEDAKKHRNDYNAALMEMMEMYGVQTEAEFMSGCVQSYHKKIGKEGTAISDIIYSIKSRLIEKYRGIFIKDLQCIDSESIDEDQAICKAAAWYNVCYNHERDEEGGLMSKKQRTKFLSFAWVNAEFLIKAFEQLSYQSLTVQKQIGLDIEESWLRERSSLVLVYQDMIAATDEINSILTHHGFQSTICGITSTMLFDQHDPKLELLCWCDNTLLYQENALCLLQTILQNHEVDCCSLNSDGLERLQFMFSSKTLSRIVRGCITMDQSIQSYSMMLLEYIFTAPWLFIVFRVLLKWLRAEDLLTSNNNIILIDAHVVCFCFIDYCLNNHFINPVNPGQVDMDDSEFSSDLNICTLITTGLNKIQTTELGSYLLGFLSEFVVFRLHPQLQSVLNHTYYFQMCSMEAIELLKEAMYRGYHNLSFHCSIISLFSAVETEKVVYLQDDSISRLSGTVQYLDQLLYRTTGVQVSSHRQTKDGVGARAGVLAKLSGKHNAIYSAEKLLRDFEFRSKTLMESRKQYPGIMELQLADHNRVIIEGVTKEHEYLKFDEYWGPHHPEDDNRGLYLLKVPTPSEPVPEALYNYQCTKFLEFKEFFLSRLNSFICQYDADIHGQVQLRVQFGRFYIVSPSRALLEQPNGLTIHQFSTLLDEDDQSRIPDVVNWKEFVRTKPKKHKKNRTSDEASSKGSFLNRVHSSITGSVLSEIIDNYGMQLVKESSYFSLHLKGQRNAIEAIYEVDNLKLWKVNYPLLKWMTIDVKRHQDSELVHDIRFDLASQDTIGDEIDTSQLIHALKWNIEESSPSISSTLMPMVISIDQVLKTEFQFDSSDPFWRHTRLTLTQLKSRSRPHEKRGKFQTHEEGYQLQLEVDLDAFELELKSEDFIAELWYQSLCLSDLLKQQQNTQLF